MVREIRNGGRLTVDVQGRVLVVAETEITSLESVRKHRLPRWLPTAIHTHPPKPRDASVSAKLIFMVYGEERSVA